MTADLIVSSEVHVRGSTVYILDRSGQKPLAQLYIIQSEFGPQLKSKRANPLMIILSWPH